MQHTDSCLIRSVFHLAFASVVSACTAAAAIGCAATSERHESHITATEESWAIDPVPTPSTHEDDTKEPRQAYREALDVWLDRWTARAIRLRGEYRAGSVHVEDFRKIFPFTIFRNCSHRKNLSHTS